MEGKRKAGLKAMTCALGMLLGGAAYAQSSVTLYGLVDGGLLYTSKTANGAGQNEGHQFSAIDSGEAPSQWGLTGTEDLGGGLKATFKLESGINLMTGGFNDSNGNFFGRQAYISLESPYGTAKAGVQFSPFFLSLYETDPRAMSQFGSGLIVYVDNLLVTGIFNGNAISYTSPTVYGFQGSAMLALGGEAGNFQAGRQYSASLKYENGSLLINAAMYSGNTGGTAPTSSTTAFLGRTIGATYKFGIVTAKAVFVNYKVAQGFNSNVFGAGLDCYVTPALDLDGGVYYTSNRNHTEDRSVMGAVGATYNVSKRTALYGQFGVVNNRGSMNTGLSIDGALTGVQGATTVGADIGIRHYF